MDDTKHEPSILEDLNPRGAESDAPTEAASDDDRSILGNINGIRDHIKALEEAALVARAVEFDHLRSVVGQLEVVAGAATQAESDLARELAQTNRVSVATARLVRQQLAFALRALSDALGVIDSEHTQIR